MLERTLENAGTTLIPAFSLGRTQELLYELNALLGRLAREKGPSRLRDVEVIVDSPLAARYTRIYRDCSRFWDGEARQQLRASDKPLVSDNLFADLRSCLHVALLSSTMLWGVGGPPLRVFLNRGKVRGGSGYQDCKLMTVMLIWRLQILTT